MKGHYLVVVLRKLKMNWLSSGTMSYKLNLDVKIIIVDCNKENLSSKKFGAIGEHCIPWCVLGLTIFVI